MFSRLVHLIIYIAECCLHQPWYCKDCFPKVFNHKLRFIFNCTRCFCEFAGEEGQRAEVAFWLLSKCLGCSFGVRHPIMPTITGRPSKGIKSISLLTFWQDMSGIFRNHWRGVRGWRRDLFWVLFWHGLYKERCSEKQRTVVTSTTKNGRFLESQSTSENEYKYLHL